MQPADEGARGDWRRTARAHAHVLAAGRGASVHKRGGHWGLCASRRRKRVAGAMRGRDAAVRALSPPCMAQQHANRCTRPDLQEPDPSVDARWRQVISKAELEKHWRHAGGKGRRAAIYEWLLEHVVVLDERGKWNARWVHVCAAQGGGACWGGSDSPRGRAAPAAPRMAACSGAHTRQRPSALRPTLRTPRQHSPREHPPRARRWTEQFEGLHIPHLRSPASVHPDPTTAWALEGWAELK